MLPYFENKLEKIFIAHYTCSYHFDSHFHNSIEIIYCFSGSQKIKIGKTIYTLYENDAAIIFPNIIHEYIKNEDSEIEAETISLICDTDYFVNTIPELKTLQPEYPLIKSHLIKDNSKNAFLQMLITKNPLELLGYTYIVLSNLIASVELKPLEAHSDMQLAPSLTQYINQNFQKPLTIKSLSKEFGYNPSYIAHIFCDQLKIPFRTYLGAVRSEYAATLISSTNKSMTQIAYESGYENLNTFCRCFKKHFSQTPTEYKKNTQKK